MSENNSALKLDRRQLLQTGTAGLAAVVLPACSGSDAPYYVAPTVDDGGSPSGEGGSAGSDGSGTDSSVAMDGNSPDVPGSVCPQDANTLVLSLAQHPELNKTGGSTAVHDARYVDPICQQSDLLVVQTSPGKFAAFSATCTHSCCTVTMQGGSLYCPCHGATFSATTGAVTRGPARQNLPTLTVCTDGASVYVQLK